MLHMLVNTHNPESCAFRSPVDDEALSGAFDRFVEMAPERGVAIQGTWVNRSGHEIFVLVDAANAHLVEETVVDSGLLGRSHTRILPVIPTDQATPSFDRGG